MMYMFVPFLCFSQLSWLAFVFFLSQCLDGGFWRGTEDLFFFSKLTKMENVSKT